MIVGRNNLPSMKTILSFCIIIFVVSVARAEIVDGVVATVGERVITYSEVMTEAKVERVFQSEDRSLSLPITASFSREILDQMINRDLVYREAKKIRALGEDADFLDEMLAFEGKFQRQIDFYAFIDMEGLKVEDLAERFLRDRVAMDYMAKRLSRMSTVSRKEVEDYYFENKASYSKGVYGSGVEIRAILMKKKMARSLDQWMLTLRKQGNVRYFTIPLD